MKIITHETANSYKHLVNITKENNTKHWNIKLILPIYDVTPSHSTKITIDAFNKIEELENTTIHLREAPYEYALYCMIFPEDKFIATKLILIEDNIISNIKACLDDSPYTEGTIITHHWKGINNGT